MSSYSGTTSDSEWINRCPILQGDNFFNKYTAQSKLGSGAYCEVWLVTETNGQKHALKVYNSDKESYKSFKYELALMRDIPPHPNILKYTEAFSHLRADDEIYTHACIVTELMEGGDVLSMMDRLKQSVAVDIVKVITKQLLSAVAHLHENGYVHRDIKIDNLLINKLESEFTKIDEVVVKLSDFNLSTQFDDDNDECPGTECYRAPEIIINKRYTASADIWSVGCLVYELLANECLFNPEYYDDSNSESSENPNTSPKRDSNDSTQEYWNNYKFLSEVESILGPAPKKFYTKANNFYNSRGHLKDNPQIEKTSIREKLIKYEYSKEEAAEIEEFLLKMINWNPASRWSPLALLQHPFLNN